MSSKTSFRWVVILSAFAVGAITYVRGDVNDYCLFAQYYIVRICHEAIQTTSIEILAVAALAAALIIYREHRTKLDALPKMQPEPEPKPVHDPLNPECQCDTCLEECP